MILQLFGHLARVDRHIEIPVSLVKKVCETRFPHLTRSIQSIASSMASPPQMPESCEPPAKRARIADEDGGQDTSSLACGSSASSECKGETLPADHSGPTEKKEPQIHSEEQCQRREGDVGITEYVNSHTRFFGILKQRFSDFIVHERRRDGSIVYLTDVTTVPALPVTNIESCADTSSLSEENQGKLQALLESSDRDAFVEIVVGEDKQERKIVHHTIKEQFPELSSISAQRDDGTRVIRVRRVQSSRDGRRRGKVQNHFQRFDQEAKFCRFVLYKENHDTMDVVNLIAKRLKKNNSEFAYAGTKDRRAITVQELTAHRTPAARLAGLNKVFKYIRVGNFSYVKEPLRLGDHGGNHFVIVLRELEGSDEDVDSAMSSLRDVGFINYFGMQRFGTSAVPTHHVGRALVAEDWSTAVDLMLKPRHGEPPAVGAARRVWAETKDAAAALEKMGRHTGVEGHLLHGLAKCGNTNYVNAFGFIPRNLRLMYLHSYQSYVWNVLTSRRIQHYGLQPVVGDLVQLHSSSSDEQETASFMKSQKSVELVSEETLEKFTIHDVVLPLPGTEVRYPAHQAYEWYKEVLAADGFNLDSLNSHVKQYSLPGGYRHIVVKPDDVTWSVLRYDDSNLPLTLTDVDKLGGCTSLPQNTDEGSLRGLRLTLSLLPSCYATMAIREVCKIDTSAANQTSLTRQRQRQPGRTKAEMEVVHQRKDDVQTESAAMDTEDTGETSPEIDQLNQAQSSEKN